MLSRHPPHLQETLPASAAMQMTIPCGFASILAAVALPLSCLSACCVASFVPLCGVALILRTAVCSVALAPSCLQLWLLSFCAQRLLCGCAFIVCRAVAVWHLPIFCLQGLLCRFASVLCAAIAVWHCPYPVHRVAVWCCFYLTYGGCSVAWPLPCLQRLQCGFESILCTAVESELMELMGWHGPAITTSCISLHIQLSQAGKKQACYGDLHWCRVMYV